jgi:cardiolipin synthase
MRLKLLVDSAEFWCHLQRDVASSRSHVYVQALTFEGDATGKAVARALLQAPAPNRRVVVDNYTKHDQSDRFLYYPPHLFDRGLWRLVRETEQMFEQLEAGGVQVQFTNPVGFLLRRFPVRNHKKLALVDGRVAYIGGINFADLNFLWRDMMLRIEDPEIVATLQEDFLSTWQGRHLSGVWSFDGLELHILDGRSNADHFTVVFDLIAGARERIYVESPALTQPFVDHLRAACGRGVAVTVLSPGDNNWGVIEDYMNWLAATSDLEIRFYQGRLTHLKAMLVDDRTLIMGSANFDPWSHWFQQEHLAVVTDPEIVTDFRERVIASGLRDSVPAARAPIGLKERLAGPQLRLLEALSLLLNGGGPGRRPQLSRERLPVEAGLSPQPPAEAQHEGSGD